MEVKSRPSLQTLYNYIQYKLKILYVTEDNEEQQDQKRIFIYIYISACFVVQSG